MAIPFPKFHENPLNLKEFKKNPKNQDLKKFKKPNSNLRSIWAILSSILMYISFFYIFNLSPSTLICTTKFWFLISNTLVLIISADFAAFSSTKRPDSYEEHTIKDAVAVPTYEKHAIKVITTTSSSNSDVDVVPTYEEHEIEDTVVIPTHDKHVIQDMTTTSQGGDTVVPTYEEHGIKKDTNAMSPNASTREEHVTENTDAITPVSKEMVTWHDVREEGKNGQRKNNINAVEGNHDKKKKKKRRGRCERSNSENTAAVVAAAEAERAVVLHRTSSERHEQRLEEEEIDEFSTMSNEELNTRVEEFIRRFNRQMRLQALRNRHNFEEN